MSQPTTEEQQEFYDRFWEERSRSLNSWEVQRLSKVLGGIATVVQTRHADLDICDLGCGTGWMSNELKRFGRVVGVDFSETALEIARGAYPGIEFQQADVLRYRPEKQFDLVVSSEVIEHIPEKAAYFETVSAILKPGGHLVLTCPNGNVRRNYGTPGQIIEEWPTKQELRKLLAKDFTVVAHDSFVHNFSNRGIMRLISSAKLNRAIRRLRLGGLYLALRGLSGFGLFHFVLALKKQSD